LRPTTVAVIASLRQSRGSPHRAVRFRRPHLKRATHHHRTPITIVLSAVSLSLPSFIPSIDELSKVLDVPSLFWANRVLEKPCLRGISRIGRESRELCASTRGSLI